MSRLVRFLFSLNTELPSNFQELYTFLRHFVLFSPFEFWVFCFFLVVTTCILRARFSRTAHERHPSRTSSPSSHPLPGGSLSRSDAFSHVLSRTKHQTNTGLPLSPSSSPASSQCTLRETASHSPMLNHSNFARSTKWHQDTKTQMQPQDPSPRRSQAIDRGTPPRNLGGVLHQDKQQADLHRPLLQRRDLEYVPTRFYRSRRKRDPPPTKAQRRAQNLAPLDTQSQFQNNSPFNIPLAPPPKQPYDAFLVLDIEGTCQLGTDFNYPNEIIVRKRFTPFVRHLFISLPTALGISRLSPSMGRQDGRWPSMRAESCGRIPFIRQANLETGVVRFLQRADRNNSGKLLFIFSPHIYHLIQICQDQVDSAPYFPEVLSQLESFLVKHRLVEKGTGQWLKKFCWCSDGPFDIRDFVVKQCFISRVRSHAGC